MATTHKNAKPQDDDSPCDIWNKVFKIDTCLLQLSSVNNNLNKLGANCKKMKICYQFCLNMWQNTEHLPCVQKRLTIAGFNLIQLYLNGYSVGWNWFVILSCWKFLLFTSKPHPHCILSGKDKNLWNWWYFCEFICQQQTNHDIIMAMELPEVFNIPL